MAVEGLEELGLQQIVEVIYDDWQNIGPDAAAYLNALDGWDCEGLTTGSERKRPRPRCGTSLLMPALGGETWRAP